MTSQNPKTPQNDNLLWNQQLATILLKAIATGGLGGLGVLPASIKIGYSHRQRARFNT